MSGFFDSKADANEVGLQMNGAALYGCALSAVCGVGLGEFEDGGDQESAGDATG